MKRKPLFAIAGAVINRSFEKSFGWSYLIGSPDGPLWHSEQDIRTAVDEFNKGRSTNDRFFLIDEKTKEVLNPFIPFQLIVRRDEISIRFAIVGGRYYSGFISFRNDQPINISGPSFDTLDTARQDAIKGIYTEIKGVKFYSDYNYDEERVEYMKNAFENWVKEETQIKLFH